MVLSRRNVLVGLGTAVAGAGAVLGTGAFTTVAAERRVSIETAGDASAFLALTPGENDEYVDDSGDTIEITLDGTSGAAGDGLNPNARSRFEDLVDVTNNGSAVVDSLTFTFDVSGSSDDAGHEDALGITAGDATLEGDGSTNLFDEISASDLGVGSTVTFGIEVDLLNSDVDDIDDDAEIALTITAEST